MKIKEKVRHNLWKRDYVRDMEIQIIEGLVSPNNISEYLGRNNSLEPNYLRALVKMFVAMLVGSFMDKLIDMVIEEYEMVIEEEKYNV